MPRIRTLNSISDPKHPERLHSFPLLHRVRVQSQQRPVRRPVTWPSWPLLLGLPLRLASSLATLVSLVFLKHGSLHFRAPRAPAPPHMLLSCLGSAQPYASINLCRPHLPSEARPDASVSRFLSDLLFLCCPVPCTNLCIALSSLDIPTYSASVTNHCKIH